MRNVIRHKWSSLVLCVIIAVSVFVMYWAFGLANTFLSTVTDDELKINGHLSYETGFVKSSDLDGMRSVSGVVNVIGERQVRAFVNSRKKNGIILVTDINERNAGEYAKYRFEGQYPQKSDEMTITTEFEEESFDVGDTAYVTTLTPDKVVNTVKYRIVGKGKIGENSVIGSDAMKYLLNSDEYVNRIIVYADMNIGKTDLIELDKRMREYFTAHGIVVDESTNYFDRIEESDVIIRTFNALKIILLFIMFPLCGASLGALVWIHAYKRRGELWTASAIGYADSSITIKMIAEYLIISTAGIVAGSLLAFASSEISAAVNGMLVFQYVIDMMLYAKVTALDITWISLFIFGNIVFWVQFPIRRILGTRPFSC
jgi:hypothetical protein